jgi:hypothetical protein
MQSLQRFGSTSMTTRSDQPARTQVTVAAVFSMVLLAGCAAEPPRPVHRVYRQAPAPRPVEKPNTDVYAYPLQGQAPEKQDRDRYECHLWAVKQTSFDPSAPNIPPHQRVRVVAGPPPGTGTAVGAVTGAIVGAAVSGPRDGGAGAVIGAVAGAAIGNASDAARANEAHREVRVEEARQTAALEQKASNYRRAVSACLEGRGYSVR